MKKHIKRITLTSIMVSTVSLSGCSAMSTAIKHHSLQTDSKMSNTIFLDPVPDNEKVVYVQVKNTSTQKMPDLKKAISEKLTASGWTVTNDVSKAYDLLQVNVLQVGKAQDQQAVWQTMQKGYGALALGGLAGVAGGYMTNSVAAGVGIGSVAALGSWVADSLVEDVTYSMITDVQVSVRSKDAKVTQVTNSNLAQGSQSQTKQVVEQKTDWIRYRTRIASLADQVNLDFEDAAPKLVQETSKEIAGILAG